MMKALEEKQIKIEKLYGFTRYLLIEINNGYGLLDCESTTCFGYFYKIYKIDFDLFYKIKKQSEDKREDITKNIKLGRFFMLPIMIVIFFILLIEFIGFNKFNLVLSHRFTYFIFSALPVILSVLFRLGYSYKQKLMINKIFILENSRHYHVVEKFSNFKFKNWLLLIINVVIASSLLIYIYVYGNLIVMFFTTIYLYLLTFSKNIRLSQANTMNIKIFVEKGYSESDSMLL